MCEAFKKTPVAKTLLGEVHKLFRLYLTLPVVTSERTFSALRRLKDYLRSTMQDRLNNCLLIYRHKSITDTLDTVKIAKRFACANEPRKGHLIWGNLSRGMPLAWCTMPPPPPHVSKRSAASLSYHLVNE